MRIKLPLAILMSLLATLLAVGPFLPATSVLAHSVKVSSSTDLASLVNPFTGTGAQPGGPDGWNVGDTFPGADVPFGMVQWSPDTETYSSGGYDPNDNRMKGFSL